MKGLLALLALALGSLAAQAAGGGAGAGGAGHQRAINSGLPPGERGPLGAPNNARQAVPSPKSVDTPRPAEDAPSR